MNVKNIEKKGNETTIVVEIDKELMESGVERAYMKARKNIMIPGFRKGKAPRKMIEKMYGAYVFYEDGLEEIFPDVYKFAVVEQDVKAVGRPNLTDMDISDEGIVTITLTTEVYPEVTLGDYKGLEVEKAEVVISDEQVAAELDRMAQNVASTETVERAAQMGDTANIDFEGFDNGVAFDGGYRGVVACVGDGEPGIPYAVVNVYLHVSVFGPVFNGALNGNAVCYITKNTVKLLFLPGRYNIAVNFNIHLALLFVVIKKGNVVYKTFKIQFVSRKISVMFRIHSLNGNVYTVKSRIYYLKTAFVCKHRPICCRIHSLNIAAAFCIAHHICKVRI